MYNNDKQQSGNSQQLVRTRPLQLPSGGSPQVPAPAPATAVNIPVPTGKKWMVAPMKSKTVAIGMMPREAGGGGLTAANRVRIYYRSNFLANSSFRNRSSCMNIFRYSNAPFSSLISYCLDRVKRIWYLSPMRAAKVQASLRIRAVSPEPSLLAHTSSESRGTFRYIARSPAPLNGWAWAVKIWHDGMLEDTNSLDGARLMFVLKPFNVCVRIWFHIQHIHLNG